MPLALPALASEVPGNFVTSALWNANVYNGLTFAFNAPIFIGTQTSTQSATSGVTTAVAMDTTILDTYAGHSNTTNNTRYVCQQAGTYLVVGSCALSGSSTGNRLCEIAKNGTVVTNGITVGLAPGSANGTQLQATAFVTLALGDYVETYVYQTSGGPLTTGANQSGMSAIWIHA